ncbi:hypothetical protein V9T40_007306 [Parthenolecanium corni]|uniref:Protein kinase domain-containing protein n=1 Tax=Parthenolecanium corni TaxID=536013 RepID=A0AAN9Y9P0_9HEMI
MEVDSPFPKFTKGKRYKISPIPKRLLFQDDDDEDENSEVFKERLAAVQRRLSFDNDDNSMVFEEETAPEADVAESCQCDSKESNDMKVEEESPPFKRIKSLKVFDSSTPFAGRTTPPSKDSSLLSGIAATPRLDCKISRFKLSPTNSSSHATTKLFNVAPVNPFTPTGQAIVSENHKRIRNHKKAFQEWLSGSSGDDSVHNSSKSLESELNDKSVVGSSLTDLEISRFAEEFKVDAFIASGCFGCVYKCTNYLDGVEYAIKKSAHPVACTSRERLARNEVFAHAALKAHRHIVTYYSSWIEDGHLFIQMEYCNRGSLETMISEEKKVFTECGLRRLANHVAKGLKYVHSLRLAHMDVKPANIFVSRIDTLLTSDEELEEIDRDDIDLVYKIGDLGRVTVVDEPYDVEDGDCRYMPKELLNENYSCLLKADVFSFGMMLYEAAGGGPLPKNGDEWQQLRSGDIPYLDKYSSTFNQIIKSMLHPDPAKRPDVKSILQKTRFRSDALQQQIFSWKVKNEFYSHHVKTHLSLMDSPVRCNENIPKIFVDHA